MSTIVEQIQQEIASLETKVVRKNTGAITNVADGVAKIDGLSEVMYNEMIEFPGEVFGIALNLEEDEVGCVIMGRNQSPERRRRGQDNRAPPLRSGGKGSPREGGRCAGKTDRR